MATKETDSSAERSSADAHRLHLKSFLTVSPKHTQWWSVTKYLKSPSTHLYVSLLDPTVECLSFSVQSDVGAEFHIHS